MGCFYVLVVLVSVMQHVIIIWRLYVVCIISWLEARIRLRGCWLSGAPHVVIRRVERRRKNLFAKNMGRFF